MLITDWSTRGSDVIPFKITWLTNKWCSVNRCYASKYFLPNPLVSLPLVRRNHQQRPWFPTETPRCSGRLWRLWRNLVPSDWEFHATCRPGNESGRTRTSCTFWWHRRTIRMTRVLHSSQWLQLCWSRSHNAWHLWECSWCAWKS